MGDIWNTGVDIFKTKVGFTKGDYILVSSRDNISSPDIVQFEFYNPNGNGELICKNLASYKQLCLNRHHDANIRLGYKEYQEQKKLWQNEILNLENKINIDTNTNTNTNTENIYDLKNKINSLNDKIKQKESLFNLDIEICDYELIPINPKQVITFMDESEIKFVSDLLLTNLTINKAKVSEQLEQYRIDKRTKREPTANLRYSLEKPVPYELQFGLMGGKKTMKRMKITQKRRQKQKSNKKQNKRRKTNRLKKYR